MKFPTGTERAVMNVCTESVSTPALRDLVHTLDRLVHTTPPARQPAAVAEALAPHLGRGDLLGDADRLGSRDHYRTNVMHVDPRGAYSIVALVWQPGQRTPIHSHRGWCVVGVHEGRELERSFRVAAGSLVQVDEHVLDQGHVTWLLEGEQDIHDVANADAATTISIHVYGLDYAAAGSSILDVYAEPDPALATAA
jgi:3-mercaptopropionate dioxygenase